MIYYTDKLLSDLVRLRKFITENNPIVANRIAGELKQGISKLDAFPHCGVEITNAPEPRSIRDLFIGNYTVRYLVMGGNISILRLWHDRENQRNITL